MASAYFLWDCDLTLAEFLDRLADPDPEVRVFGELRVSDGEDVCVVDLVTEPLPAVASPQRATVEDTEILVDSKLGRALGWSAEQSADLDAFRRQPIGQLMEVTRPE